MADYGDFRVDCFTMAWQHKIASADAIVGRWDGHTLNSGGVDRMAAEPRSVVAEDRGGRDQMSERGGGKIERLLSKRGPFFVLGLLWG